MSLINHYEVSGDLQDGAVLEVVRARSSLERAERHAGASQRRDVAEVVATDRRRLVVAAYDRSHGQVVRLLTRRRVELPRSPRRPLRRSLVDRKALRTTRVKLQSDVRYLERLTYIHARQTITVVKKVIDVKKTFLFTARFIF